MKLCSIDRKLTDKVVSETTYLLQGFALRSRPADKDARVLNFVWDSSSSLESWADILTEKKELNDKFFPQRSFWCSFDDALKEHPDSPALKTFHNDQTTIAVRLVSIENGQLVSHTITIMKDAFRNKTN